MQISNKIPYIPSSADMHSGLKPEPSGSKPAVLMPKNHLVPQNQRIDQLMDIYDDKTLKRMGVIECATCASRTYQDGSDDPSVSFKTPTKLSPSQASTAVMAHEQEHVSHEQTRAEKEGREVISQSVQIFTAICPECGKVYVSGGVTKTTTKNKNENPYSTGANPVGKLLDYKL